LGRSLDLAAHQLAGTLTGSFDSVTIHTPRTLIGSDPTWREQFEDHRQWVRSHPDFRPNLRWNEQWAALGFLRWKPRLLLEALHVEDRGVRDIVLYHDADAEKYPDYLRGTHRRAKYVAQRLGERDVLLFTDDLTDVRGDTKPELLSAFGIRLPDRHVPHVNATFLAVRASDEGRAFVRTWMEMTAILDHVSPITTANTEDRFTWHTHEQATLGVLYLLTRRGDVLPNCRIRLQSLRGTRRIPPPAPMNPTWLRIQFAHRLPRIHGVVQRIAHHLSGRT
ncbi:MAG: hypothetical protein RLZZ163_355, partial [Actinomycetota bacterium]